MHDLKMDFLPRLIASLSKRPGNLRALGEQARVLLGYALVLDPDGPEGARWLRLLARP